MKNVQVGEALNISIRSGLIKAGLAITESAKRIERKVSVVYKEGHVTDNCGEIWKVKRTSAGLVAIMMVLLLTGCMPRDSIVFDEPERIQQRAPLQGNAQVIESLTDSGCQITQYKARERLRELTISCK